MASSTAQKFRIREQMTILIIDAPKGIEKSWSPLPPGVQFSEHATKAGQVHWFVRTKKEMEKGIKKVLGLVKGDTVCWIFYPKGSSGLQTDLNRDNGWEELMKHDMQWINLLSFDDTWSAFGMREKTEADRKKESRPKPRPVFEYVDPETKTVKLPEDFEKLLHKSKKAAAFFDSLSFTNKKEYIEWIVTAKREETRQNRLKESMERLDKHWKNPANRN